MRTASAQFTWGRNGLYRICISAQLDGRSVGSAFAALILKSVERLYKFLSNQLFLSRHFTITGIWVAYFKSHLSDRYNIEVLRVAQYKETVAFYQQQFRSDSKGVRHYTGRGIIRGVAFSAVYTINSKSRLQNGALSMYANEKSDGDVVLVGKYAEFNVIDGSSKITIGEELYTLKRVKLSIKSRLLMLLRRPCFESFDDAKQHLDDEGYFLEAEVPRVG